MDKKFHGKPMKSSFVMYILMMTILALGVVYFLVKSQTKVSPKPELVDGINIEFGQCMEVECFGLDPIYFKDMVLNLDAFDVVTIGLLDDEEKFIETDLRSDTIGETFMDLKFESGKNVSFHKIRLNVQDTYFPMITSPDSIITNLNTVPNYNLEVLAYDQVEGKLTTDFVDSIDYEVPGTYDLVVSATDKNLNTVSKTIKVTVANDNINPGQTEGPNKVGEIENEKPFSEIPKIANQDSKNNNSNELTNSKPTLETDINEDEESQALEVIPNRDHRDDPEEISKQLNMTYFKDFLDVELCIAEVYDLSSLHWNDWESSYCDDNGYLFYKEKN